MAEAGRPRTPEVESAAVGGHPQRAVDILFDRIDLVVRQAASIAAVVPVMDEAARGGIDPPARVGRRASEEVEPSVARADPERAVPIEEQRGDRVAGEAVGTGAVAAMARGHAALWMHLEQAGAPGPDPERTVVPFGDRAHVFVDAGHAPETLLLPVEEAQAVARAHP
jgi:hypothetical protein